MSEVFHDFFNSRSSEFEFSNSPFGGFWIQKLIKKEIS